MLRPSIVAVHGLNGHSFQTWTSTGSKPRMWLRDFLPRRIPRARIMTYGYNSNVNDKACTTTIHEFAGRLLVDLSALRRHGDEKRPIIFLCHSLGGIVVKEVPHSPLLLLLRVHHDQQTAPPPPQALNRARKEPHHALLATATHGIIFLATPHGGSKTAEFGSILGMAARALGVREDLIQTLRCDSARLKQIQADFRAHYDGCVKIATFVETRKLPGWGGLGIVCTHTHNMRVDPRIC